MYNALRAFALRRPWAVITAAVLFTYWPLASFGYSLPHGDTLDCWLPWRFFIAACLQNGELPLWNPMQQMGYPIHADLQGPAWYLEALALGGTVGHPLWVLQSLFLAYVIIGGLGMRRVVRTVHAHDGPALIIGVAYALGGFFTGHTMHFYSVISAAWLPWMLDAQLRLMRTPHWRHALSAAVFQAFLLTGGNHTFTILGAYLVLTLFAMRAFGLWRQDRPMLRTLVGKEILFVGATILMACGTLWSAVEVIPWMTRGEGLALGTAEGGAFTARAWVSLLFPFAMGIDKGALGTDPTMANGFMGVLTLGWALLAFMRKRDGLENVLLVFGAVCALAAVGPMLPVHRTLWAFLPGMDLFRFPSYFLWGTQFAVLVLAGGTLARWNELLMRRGLVLLVLGSLTAVALGLVLMSSAGSLSRPVDAGLYETLKAMSIAQRVLLNGAVVVPVMLMGLWCVWRRRGDVGMWGVLLLMEMMWSTGLAVWNTSIGDLTPFAVQARIDAFPSGPVVPPLEPMRNARDNAGGLQVLWRNTQVYKGRPSFEGFNSFQLRHTAELMDRHTGLRDRLLERPLLFLGDAVRGVGTGAGTVELTAFSYSSMEAVVHADVDALLNVQQAWYPGWTAVVDGVEVPVEGVNVAGFAVRIPRGVHEVRFVFRKPFAPWLLALSMGSLFVAMLALAWTGIQRHQRIALVLVLVAMTAFSLLAHGTKDAAVERGLQHLDSAGPVPQVVSTDRPTLVGKHLPNARILRCGRDADVAELVHVLAERRSDRVDLALVGLPLPPEALPVLNDAGWHLEEHTTIVGIELLRLVRQLPGADGVRLHFDALGGGQVLVTPGAPYSAAYRQRVGDLDFAEGDRLCVDLKYRAVNAVRTYVVMERKRGDRTLDYEAIPLVTRATSDTSWRPFMVLRDRRELRDPDAELAVYVWNDGPDTVWVKDLQVRMVGGPRVKDGG